MNRKPAGPRVAVQSAQERRRWRAALYGAPTKAAMALALDRLKAHAFDDAAAAVVMLEVLTQDEATLARRLDGDYDDEVDDDE